MNRWIFFVCFGLLFLFFFKGNASADSVYCYTSLEEALKNPSAVKNLQLKKQKLKVFPPEIFLFENLENLDLSNNKIAEIPVEVKKLKHLKYLKLYKNSFLTFPKNLILSQNLETLDLSRNPISELPASIVDLQRLKELILWSTYIRKLPSNMVEMQNHLKLLDLRNVRMTPDEQREILQMFSIEVKIRIDKSCNCY